MAFGAKFLDTNGLEYLCNTLAKSIVDFQNNSKAIIDSSADAANSAADRVNAALKTINDEYATKDELGNAIAGITVFEFLIVTRVTKYWQKRNNISHE